VLYLIIAETYVGNVVDRKLLLRLED